MAWTPLTYAGAAAVQITGDYSWLAISNLADGGGTFVQFPNNANQGDISDIVKLTNWNITIPGGGAAVTKVRYSYFGAKSSTGADTVRLDTGTGFGVSYNSSRTPDLTGSYVYYTQESSPAVFGLTATEIDNLVSNSASYGMTMLAVLGSVQNGIQTFVREIGLEFEYPSLGSMMYAAK